MRRHLIAIGAPDWLARLYWFGSKILRPWFGETEPVPTGWLAYLERHIDIGERRRESDFA